MLKFFSPRDDENESLLGAITEGKKRIDFNGVWMALLSIHCVTDGEFCASVFVTEIC